MFMLFLLLMEYHLLPDLVHEWLGISVFVLFAIHNILNYRWYAVLLKGKYSAIRVIQTVLNFLLIIVMVLCTVSALFVSRKIFAGLNLHAGMFGRTLHMKASAWMFILMNIHLGLHFGMFIGMVNRFNPPVLFKAVVKWLLRVAVLITAIYGIIVFMQRDFYEELFVTEVFRGNFDKKTVLVKVTYFLQTVAMSVTFTSIAYYAKKFGLFIKKFQRKKQNEKNN